VTSSERIVKDIRRAIRKQHSAEEKIRIVLDGNRGEYNIAELCLWGLRRAEIPT
jgi:transposase